MFKALLKSRLSALFSSMFRSSRLKKNRGPVFKLLIAVFAVYILGCFFLMFGQIFYSICTPLAEYGLAWLYFALAAIMTTTVCFIGSVFMAQQQLFMAQDNDLLLSMPIPPAYILGSRILLLLVFNYFLELLVIVPAGFVYITLCAPGIVGVIIFIICALILPLIPMTFSCLFAWLLALITDRVRNKSIVTTVFSLCFLAGYFYVFSNMNNYIGAMIQNGAEIAAAVKSAVYPAYSFGAAIAEGSFVQMVVFLLCCIVPFALVYMALSRSFIKISTSQRGAAKIKYRERALRVGSTSSALLKKELMHFASNGMYIMNAALGSVFTLAAAVALIIYRDLPDTIIIAVPELAQYLQPAAAAALCMLAATDIISAPSVSLEGKNLWIAQSMPVPGGKILMAKANMHIVVALPPVIVASLAVLLVLRPETMMAAAIMLAPALMTVFCALFGVVVNLHFPRFDYINEVAVVKQSLSSIISMLVSMGMVALPAALYAAVLKDSIAADHYLLLISGLLALLSLVMFRYLNTAGARRFADL